MSIRREKNEDGDEVCEILLAAFGSAGEANLVERLMSYD